MSVPVCLVGGQTHTETYSDAGCTFDYAYAYIRNSGVDIHRVPLVGSVLDSKTYDAYCHEGASFVLYVHFHGGTWGATKMSPQDIEINFDLRWTPRGWYAQFVETRVAK